MSANPFYVQPGGNYAPGLQGLSSTLDKQAALYREKKAKEVETQRLNTMNLGAAEAYKSGDPDAIADYALKNPEVAQNLLKNSELRDTRAKDFYVDTMFQVLQNPENAEKILTTRQGLAKAQGLQPKETRNVSEFMEKFNEDPDGVLKKLEQEVAFFAPAKYKQYKAAVTSSVKEPAKVQEFKYYQDLKKTNPDMADQFGIGAGFVEGEDKETVAARNFDKYINLLNTNPEQAKLFGDQIGINRVTPRSDLAKLKEDLNNGLVSKEDYISQRNKILNPTMKTKVELTAAALKGDPEAINILKHMAKDAIELAGDKSKATTEGKLEGLKSVMDVPAVAQAVLEGRETIDNVRNTFGVPIQEQVRKAVLAQEPNFNFVQPRAFQKALNSSLTQQQKNRGSMGSFVQNINGQLGKVDKIMTDVIGRVGMRYIDKPWRELHTRVKGSGSEKVLEAYMKEISVEIAKLAQGSTASVALLPEASREEWEAIHDVNLSYPQLKKVLEGTRDMANIRLKSVNDEIERTVEQLGNIRNLENTDQVGSGAGAGDNPNHKRIYNPNTKEYEVWDKTTKKRVK